MAEGLAPRAEEAAARLPPLVVEAERVAATLMQGAHGRRRAGMGDAFWQFRPYVTGDAAARVDWRQSAKGDRLFVRETEWEAAQTVVLWRDRTASMDWRSGRSLPTKAERADLLLLALAALLLRGGERVRLAPGPVRSFAGRGALPALAAALARTGAEGPPDDAAIPRHARIVLFGDFLQPLPEAQELLHRFAARPLRGQMLQVLDPAEEALPYGGRVRFEGLEGEAPTLVPRVEDVRGLYAERLAGHRAALSALARTAGWGFATHRTDQPPQLALLGLWQALSPA
ncbi:DUF58 domain-containing protein [Sabulicella glaciei]|uniref:DUF58 domain-containing protein n=1 Tax=Sabulicella glaciei TaxID=2984948 RepID=A0ABT3NYM6_9PROT|nr:DUF58 domain-containing protein [Roseococcus sp. MDT2-1-1]MCW8087270.1 DUF58 domain-containing protein [Roseococcus sp. MDT2-1-1]